jgi:amino acid adenylation domain-containing protein
MSTQPKPITAPDYATSTAPIPRLKLAGSDRRRVCVPDLVMQATRSTPEAIALSHGSDRMTYAQLTSQAMRLASYLRTLGVGPDVPVGICLERSFDFIVASFAVLLAGGAYLPLDPTWPDARLGKILGDAQASLVISRGSLAARMSSIASRAIDLDSASSAMDRSAPLSRPASVTRENLAYIIYTSGSTGEPKGVEVTHGNLLNLIFWHRNTFGITSRDRASHLAGVGFDAAVWEIWPNLAAGASVALVDEQVRTSAGLLRDWLVAERITVAFVPTIFAESMLGYVWPRETALRFLLTGGEALHRYPAPGLPFTVVNNYGPTECTVVATSGVIAPGPAELTLSAPPPSIGKPIAHTHIRILDHERRRVAAGQVGEIYITGSSVARGYRNSPQMTADRFVVDPFSVNPAARMYRTGDLGCVLPDGQIAFRGRVDSQEQIHGYRVEPDEIVCLLNRHPGVGASAVVARSNGAAKTLVAYLVPRESAALTASGLREFLSASLPHYMVPSTFVRVTALPLNSNGKLDRAALPEPSASNRIEDTGYRAPGTPTEESLVQILAELLEVDRVGADDNFFLLGFHSLLATQVAVRVHQRFGIQLGLRHLFEAKTVTRLAAELDRQLVEKLNSMSDEEVARCLSR